MMIELLFTLYCTIYVHKKQPPPLIAIYFAMLCMSLRRGAIDRALICLNKMIAPPQLIMHFYPNRLAVGVKNTYASSCPTAD